MQMLALAATLLLAGEPAPAAGGTPVLDPNVCDNKPVVMVIDGSLKDRDRLAGYAKAIRDSGLYDKLGGYYINNPRTVAVFEGTPPPERSILLVRFPCYAHARAFWYSKQYQEQIIPLRQNPSAGDFLVTVHAENAVPAYLNGRVSTGAYAPVDPAVAAAIPRLSPPGAAAR
jgi:uncharacterized protein (DUF1330 family)